MPNQTALADVLRKAGCKVSEAPGWKTRGHGSTLTPVGIMLHHTGGRYPGDRTVVLKGRSDLPGPLCNLYLGPKGHFRAIAAGVAYHAGSGSQKVIDEARRGIGSVGTAAQRRLRDTTGTGNHYFIGIEVSNLGGRSYPKEQIDALVKGLAALCKHYGWTEKHIKHHKEYTARKVDMSYRGKIRGRVALLLHPPAKKAAPKSRPNIKEGSSGKLVVDVQRALHITPDGQFGPKTKAAVYAFQRKRGWAGSGVVGPLTWRALGF